MRTLSSGEWFGELALIYESNKRTASVRVASDTALILCLGLLDVDDDLLDTIRSAATKTFGNLKMSGETEAQLEESKEECASTQ